ncbi:uncharacterized protein LOC123653436 [Melitaea cinxia]|uniref:uncharacterized protein LOC123653436 n=1 Tax=Melitaea cinxia TaxID=113334 RepID=UPI001E2743F5|nr:uncharacterized protein LOC123653436 [Melitaea cinxia]
MYNSNQTNDRIPRKRGPNYTEAEKENLMFLAKRYNNIIESKATGTAIFKKKADAWAQLVKSYNASSTTGIRTTEQLKHLYENMKQNARKALATSNKADYLHKLEEEKAKAVLESLDKSDKENISDLETLKFLDKADKIARKKTGGGCFIPNVHNKDLKVLELIKDQVEPLHSPFDSAASYFKDDFTPDKSVEERANKADEPFPVENQIVVCEIIDVDNDFKEVNEKPKDHNIKKNKFRTQQKTRKETQGPSMVSDNKNKTRGKNYKAAYFKQKYQNSILERRRIYQDIRLRQKEHMLLSKKLKLEIEILEKNK